MAQVTIYLDKVIHEKMLTAAKKSNKSLSSWARECLHREADKDNKWDAEFLSLLGNVDDDSFAVTDDFTEVEESKRETF